jgi:hypothetical protein
MKYLIVLFKNKERKKIIKKFKTKERAEKFFDKLLNNDVVFNKEVENGKSCEFELGILENDSKDFTPFYVRDELGRQIKIEIDDPNYKITKISKYKVEEFLYDLQTKNKIPFKYFYSKYLKVTGLKFISKLNNKLLVQEDDNYFLFSLKSDGDSNRFLKILEDTLYKNKRSDCVVVYDTSIQQKKYLYSILESKGISKSFLYRNSTTFFTE